MLSICIDGRDNRIMAVSYTHLDVYKRHLMNRCLSQHKLMESLQHTSIMLTELRNPNLSPKKYYELYVIIFDSLTNLSTYLIENHPQNHHLADLYELVQYTGNVVPRLYLMITVGTSYLTFNEAPKKEILKDMIEMCRGCLLYTSRCV